jgi:ribosome-associated protein
MARAATTAPAPSARPWSRGRRHAKRGAETGVRALSPKKAVKKKAAKKPAATKGAAKKVVKKPAAKDAAKLTAKAPAKPAAKPARKVTKKPATKVARKTPAKAKVAKPVAKVAPQSELLRRIVASLDDDKAENIITIDLEGRGAIADAAVVASGRSSRHVAAIADHLARRLKEGGYGTRPISGAATGDWVLVDAGDVIVHVFRPEVREYYDLEGMWNVGTPGKV